jgi:hypothetical protein
VAAGFDRTVQAFGRVGPVADCLSAKCAFELSSSINLEASTPGEIPGWRVTLRVPSAVAAGIAGLFVVPVVIPNPCRQVAAGRLVAAPGSQIEEGVGAAELVGAAREN